MAIMSGIDLGNQETMSTTPVVTVPTAVNPSPTPTLQSEVKIVTPNEPQEKTPEEIDAEKRKEHEAAEAKRKEEWEAKKKARDDEILFAWEEAIDVSDDELSAKSVERLGEMTERLTRRNMKHCVTEYIQTRCYESVKFAQHALHPKKSMINCFKYINEKALEYLKEEQKNNGEQQVDNRVIGGDVPDELCYQWGEEYFMDLNAKVDKTEEDEEFVPKPYRSSIPTKSKKKETKKKEPAKKPEPAKTQTDNQMQLSFDSPQQTMLEGA